MKKKRSSSSVCFGLAVTALQWVGGGSSSEGGVAAAEVQASVLAHQQPGGVVEAECNAQNGVCEPTTSATKSPTDTQPQQQPYCGLYLAESTIPGAGLGVFTAEPKQKGDILGRGDACIPFVDVRWHNGDNMIQSPWKDYFWKGSILGMGLETDTDDMEALCFGLDAAVNCNLALINVDKMTPSYSTAGLHRANDPGVGAFTPYHNGTSKAARDIPAGSELFKTYGDKWFTTRQRIFGLVPLTLDYPAAQELLHKMQNLPLSHDSWNDFYEMVVLQINQGAFESRTLNALPKTAAQAQQVLKAGGDLAAIHQPAAVRSLEWLQQHGRCMDHIQPGRSTLPQAGHGAFAVRHLPAGTIITTSPLHHVPHERFMNMYQFTQIEDKWYREIDNIKGYQLMTNYCYGHGDSSVLLCPYGGGVSYINHNQTRANVRVRWSDFGPLGAAQHQQWLVQHGEVADLEKTTKPLLAFDYIATRDIAEGEELFLDYGNEWEQAWQEHVKNYQPAAGQTNPSSSYASAQFWNSEFADMTLRTQDEQQFDQYPEHLQLRCHSRLTDQQNPNIRPPQLSHYKWNMYDYGYPCQILDRFWEEGSYWYTIRMELREGDNNNGYIDMIEQEERGRRDQQAKTVTWIERTDVPRSAIRFFDRPGTTDMHLPNAFRHCIYLPDDMFPEKWRNYASYDDDDEDEEYAEEE